MATRRPTDLVRASKMRRRALVWSTVSGTIFVDGYVDVLETQDGRDSKKGSK